MMKPGLRLAVGLSGGADSVALVHALAERSKELGLVLHAAHLHHGLRGEEADGDLAFARALAAELGLPFHEARVDTAAGALANPGSGKPGESIEEAARRLRYGWFRQLMASGEVDAAATAHTRDDQAETVLGKFLRGAWTEGLSGIHPVIEFPEGRILRPLLGTTRAEVEVYLVALGQGWREDSSNRHLTFTRNRIRHELLPLLEGWNPRLREHLTQMAALARDEEAWWSAEVARIAPQLLLPGRPVRGGGRAAGDGLAIDVIRLAALPLAIQRRLLRYAAVQLGAAVDFPSTEALRAMALAGRAGQRLELAEGLRGERTPRELRLTVLPGEGAMEQVVPEYVVAIPGEVTAEAFGLRLQIEVDASPDLDTGEQISMEGGFQDEAAAGAKAQDNSTASAARLKSCPDTSGGSASSFSAASKTHFDFGADLARLNSRPDTKQNHFTARVRRIAVLRNWRAGDRVWLRHSSGPRKVKEVLERLKVTGSGRRVWPVLELDGRIVWMRGVEVEPMPRICVTATDI